MDVQAVAAMASSMKSAETAQQASLLMMKKALEMQEASAAMLLQALPEVPSAPVGTAGGVIDTWA